MELALYKAYATNNCSIMNMPVYEKHHTSISVCKPVDIYLPICLSECLSIYMHF